MFEIVAGDFGSPYKIVVKNLDLALCTATIKVWKDSTILIDGKSCSSITYDSGEDESYCYFTPIDGDFPLTAAIDGKITTYDVMVEFTKTGYKEHDMGFEWTVTPAPPS